jgi:hypothetical protein
VTANASQAVCKHYLFLCCPLHFTAGNAAAWQLRYSFIFLIDEMQSRKRNRSVGLVMLSQPPQVLLYFED